MPANSLIIHSQIIPPRKQKGILNRPGLESKIAAVCDFPLTIVQAGTGYGKSTSLALLQNERPSLAWYTITLPHRDPLIFFAHLIQSFLSAGLEGMEPPEALLAAAGGRVSPDMLTPLLNALTSAAEQDFILVLDDIHLVIDVPEITALIERLIDYAPPGLHIVLSTRRMPKLDVITRKRVKGNLLLLTREDLAFSAVEIAELFRENYSFPLTDTQCQELMQRTEGWAIAIQLIWQNLQRSDSPSLDSVLGHLPSTLEALFDYLAKDVLARQTDAVQTFLLKTSVLHDLHPETCNHLLEIDNSSEILAELSHSGLFLVRLGETYRYHNLFRDFLQEQAVQRWSTLKELHERSALYFEGTGHPEEAIYHWLHAEEFDPASQLMVSASAVLQQTGRLDTLSEWVTALPPAVLDQNPILMYRMGEMCRFASRFDEALAWYGQAQERYAIRRDVTGVSRALRGQAAVHLDTVHPNKAESLLQEALRLIDGQQDREEQARLLDLMGENMTNRGRSEEAKALHEQASSLRAEGPGRADLDVRVLLRTGRLEEAEIILEERSSSAPTGEKSFRQPRSHRETLLVLSLIQVFQGKSLGAYTNAIKGIELGRALGSPFVEAVGYMRLGHAVQLMPHPDRHTEALDYYQRAMSLAEQLAVPRTKVEAFWGLCRLHGFQGDLSAAEHYAHQGMELALKVGDEWIAAHIETTLGGSFLLAGELDKAKQHLRAASQAMIECGDPFGRALTLTWQSLLFSKRKEPQLGDCLDELIELAHNNSYDFLFKRQTFLAPPEPPALITLLLNQAEDPIRKPHVNALLKDIDLPADLGYHPRYSLRISTLGLFILQRGTEIVSGMEWHREKSKSLFQFLLAHRGRYLDREEILTELWPDIDTETAENRFKVTLNALNQVLEPDRPPRAPTRFIQRRGNAYGINLEAPLYCDAIAMEDLLKRALDCDNASIALDLHQKALSIYQGDFLPDCLYMDWSRSERDRLRMVYKEALTRTAEMQIQQGDYFNALRYTQRALAVDNCMESAYRLLMRIYNHLGNRVEAMRTYEHCVKCLREELDVEPMAETISLYEEIRSTSA